MRLSQTIRVTNFSCLIAPSTVRNLKIFLPSDNSVNVTCEQPVDLNGPGAYRYHLEVKTGGALVTNESKAKCDFLLKDLHYSTPYAFEVRGSRLPPPRHGCAGHGPCVCFSR